MSDQKNTDDFAWLRSGSDPQDDWPVEDDSTPPAWEQPSEDQPDLLGDRLGFTGELSWRGGEAEASASAGSEPDTGLTGQLPWMRRHTDEPLHEQPADDDLAWLRGTEDDLLAGRVEPPAPPSKVEPETSPRAASRPHMSLPSWLVDEEEAFSTAIPTEPETVWEPSVAAETSDASLSDWLAGDEPAISAPSESQLAGEPSAQAQVKLPTWLLDEEEPASLVPPTELPLVDDTGALSQAWLKTGELLPETVESDLTFDEWMAQQAEAERVPDIEEQLPEFGLGEDEPLDAGAAASAVDTSELPDWFLGLEELDTSTAPAWFTSEAPLPVEPTPPSETPPPPPTAEVERAGLDESFLEAGDLDDWFSEDVPPSEPSWLENVSGSDLPKPEPADLSFLEAEALEAAESAARTSGDDIDSLLARLGGDEVVLPSTASAEVDLDFDALLDESVLEDFPELAGRDEPLLPPEAPDWLAEMGATVGGVSAAALVRQREDRPLAELPDRLRELRARGEKVLTQRTTADPGPLAKLLPGVKEVLPPAPLAPTVSSVAAGLLLTPDQRRRAELLRALAGPVDRESEDMPVSAGTGFLEDEDDFPFEAVFDETPVEQSIAEASVPAVSRARLKPARLLIALLVAAGVILPFFVPTLRIGELPPAEFAVGSGGRTVFDALNSLRPGDLVLVGVEYGPAAAGELDSLTNVLLRHILLRQARPVIVGTNPVGVLRADGILRDLGRAASPFLAELGRSAPLRPNDDYYVARYLPAAAVGLRTLGLNPAALVTTDLRGQPTGLADIALADFAAVVLVGERAEDVRGWAEQVAPLTTAPLLVATGFSAAPLLEPYVGPSFAGLLVGFPDAVTYAALLALPNVRQPAPELMEESAVSAPEATEEPALEPVFTPTAAPTTTPTPVLPSAVVFSTQSVNVRQGPAQDFAVITTAEPGTEVLVLEQSGDGLWSRVRLPDGREGWMSSSLLRLRPNESAPATLTPAPTDTPPLTPTLLAATDTPPPTVTARPTDMPTPTTTGAPAAATATTPPVTATPLPPTVTLQPPTATPQPLRVTAVVVANQNVNVRSGPATSFPPIGSLPPGAQVEVIGRSGDAGWIQVRLADGREGWVSASLLQINVPQGSSYVPHQRRDAIIVVMADSDIGSLLRQEAPPPAPAVPYAEERWYGMNLGLLVIVLIILVGTVVNTARSILQRRR